MILSNAQRIHFLTLENLFPENWNDSTLATVRRKQNAGELPNRII